MPSSISILRRMDSGDGSSQPVGSGPAGVGMGPPRQPVPGGLPGAGAPPQDPTPSCCLLQSGEPAGLASPQPRAWPAFAGSLQPWGALGLEDSPHPDELLGFKLFPHVKELALPSSFQPETDLSLSLPPELDFLLASPQWLLLPASLQSSPAGTGQPGWDFCPSPQPGLPFCGSPHADFSSLQDAHWPPPAAPAAAPSSQPPWPSEPLASAHLSGGLGSPHPAPDAASWPLGLVLPAQGPEPGACAAGPPQAFLAPRGDASVSQAVFCLMGVCPQPELDRTRGSRSALLTMLWSSACGSSFLRSRL